MYVWLDALLNYLTVAKSADSNLVIDIALPCFPSVTVFPSFLESMAARCSRSWQRHSEVPRTLLASVLDRCGHGATKVFARSRPLAC